MYSLRAFINLKRNPLNQMTYSSVGLHPLPVETWERIFFLVGESSPSSNKISHDIYHFFSPEHERYQRQQHESTASISEDLFHTRLSIVLVCRSWYCVGIRILLSHVIFGGKDLNKRAASFFKTLKRSSMMGTFITQVTIETKKASKVITKVPDIAEWLPRLPNLAIISCPFALIWMLPSSLQTRMAFVRHEFASNKVNGYFNDHRTCFWLHCRVLSFTHSEQTSISLPMDSQVTFPNLADLRLEVTHQKVIRWISSTWVLPALKNLSILTSSDNGIYSEWVSLFKRTQKTIEKLQISSQFNFISEGSLIDAPRLKEVHIIHPTQGFRKPQKEWQIAITASKIERFAIYLAGASTSSQKYRSSIISMINLAQNHLPSIKRICIIAYDDRWKAPSYRHNHFVITTKDIAGWCRNGLEVEIISKAEVGLFTKDSFSQEEFEYWDSYVVLDYGKYAPSSELGSSDPKIASFDVLLCLLLCYYVIMTASNGL